MEKEADYAFFLDTSTSVRGSVGYFETVKEIVQKYRHQVSEWYFWNSEVEPCSELQVNAVVKERKGWAATDPSKVARTVIHKKITRLILVTDGEVPAYTVEDCDKLLQNHRFQSSICYIISSGGNGELNMSVTCPFTRNCESEVYSQKYAQPLQSVASFKSEDFKLLDTLNEITLQDFESKFELLKGLIISLNMGKEGNIPLKNELVKLQKRLVHELSQAKAETKGEAPGPLLRKALEKEDFETIIKELKRINYEYFSDDSTFELARKISKLISLCGDLRGKFNLNEIKSNDMAIAKDAVEGRLQGSVECHDLSKNPVECPIVMDEDIPQILVDECEPLLVGLEKNVVEDITVCPLRILNYPEVKQKFKERLSNFVGIKIADKLLKNPFTQRKLIGAIPLGTHESHVAVGNYTLAKMVTGGKVLGNLNMYYAVVWHLIREGSIEYLKDIEKNAEEHLIFRLRNSRTTASLNGAPQFVTTQLPMDVAVWYCVNSGFFNQPTNRDTFRFHVFNIEPMIDMCKVLGYPLLDGTRGHVRRTKAMLRMLSMVKKFTADERISWKNQMKCLYQKGIRIDTKKIKNENFAKLEAIVEYIPVDGPADKDQIEQILNSLPISFQKLSVEQIFYLASQVGPQNSASDIFLDFQLQVPDLPKYEVNWAYGEKQFPCVPIKVCPKTYRPVCRIGDQTWLQVATGYWKVSQHQMFSGFKYFGEFVLKHRTLPQLEELLIFYYNRYVVNGGRRTLPFMTKSWTESVINDYGFLFKEKVTADQFEHVFSGSRSLPVRESMETGKPMVFEGGKGPYQYKKNYDFYF